VYCNLDLAPENQNKSNLLNTILSLRLFFVIGRRRQLLEATRRTNFTTSTDERKLLHLGFCIAETGQHGYFSAYSNRCDHRVRVQLLSTTAEASVLPVRSELAMSGALPVLQHQAPAATASIAAWFCHGRQWPLECANPWNNLFAAASFIDSICIRNAVLLPSQSLVNQHPCNIETESETETHTPLHRQKESTREASF
jgi:hypothetical protein